MLPVLAGLGPFTLDHGRRGCIIVEYFRDRIDNDTANYGALDYNTRRIGEDYLLTVSAEPVLPTTRDGNHSSLVHHHCRPNAPFCAIWINLSTVDEMFMEAIRTIYPGEETFTDYYWVSVVWDPLVVFECDASKCSGFIGTMQTQ